MIESIIKYSEFACGITLFLFAILQFAYKNRKFINYNLAGLYFCLSYVILTFWSFKSGMIFHVPWLLYSDLAIAFAIGPFVFFYIRTVLGLAARSFAAYLVHFIPAVLVLIVVIINNLIDGSLITYYQNHPQSYPIYNLSHITGLINTISNLYMLIYFVLTIRNIYSLFKTKSHKSMRELRIILIYMFCIAALSALLICSNISGSIVLTVISIYLLTLMGVWYFIFSFRYPEFTQKAIKEAKTIRYQNSIVGSFDAEVVLGRLDDLMEDEKVFTDNELTLKKLSSLLMVTPHQLSMILNSKRNMNFRSMINAYRINEAKNQLVENPDKTILEIALDCGFNSKSSFNDVFMKSTGIVPRDYRKTLINTKYA